MKNIKKLIALSLITVNLEADSLKQVVEEVLNTNPIVKERLRNYRATQQDLKMAESGYFPKIDFRSSASYQQAGNIKSEIEDESFKYYENSLKLTQNLFNGFKTEHQVDYEEARILAAAYNYLEKANDIAFDTVGAYLNVLKNEELRQNAQRNVSIHKQFFEDAKELFDSRILTRSELGKIEAAYSMAKVNYITQLNTLKDSKFSYARIVGRKPIVEELSFPNLSVNLPKTMQEATMYAIKNNPSLVVGQYNIKGAQALYNRDKNTFYPVIDFELEQYYHDASPEDNGYESVDDRLIARVSLQWNLYNGGFDDANVKKKISKIAQEVEIKRNLKREVIEGLELSWSAYNVFYEKLEVLKEYDLIVQETLQSTLEEYKLGKKSKKTLLDLMNAYSNVINSNSKIVSSRYNELFAKFRILDAMGLMVTSLLGDEDDYRNRVNLDVAEAKENLDQLPITLDDDNDKIVDDLDICDNSVKGDNIMPYGCIKQDPIIIKK